MFAYLGSRGGFGKFGIPGGFHLPPPVSGFTYLKDVSGAYLKGVDGAYLLGAA